MLAFALTRMMNFLYRALRTNERVVLRIVALGAAKFGAILTVVLADKTIWAQLPILNISQHLFQLLGAEFPTIPQPV